LSLQNEPHTRSAKHESTATDYATSRFCQCQESYG
jgi:hypothetical protein